jgi:hypothetical protein
VKRTAVRVIVKIVLWAGAAFTLALTLAPKRYKVPAP